MLSKNFGHEVISRDNLLYINSKIIVLPQEIKEISLPYKIVGNYKFIGFQISKNLAKLGLSVMWNNLNEESRKNSLNFLIINNSIDENMSPLESIIGSKFKIKLDQSDEFGKIFFV